MQTAPPLFEHQKKSIKFLGKQPRVFDMSDPGTGKTRVGIEAFAARRRKKGGCLLVVAPKSLLEAAWREDFGKYAPDMHCVVAAAANRAEAFAIDADVYITNHDAANWLVKQKPAFFKKFDSLEVDESTAFKHHTSARSKAMAKIAKNFAYIRLASGTPTSNGICDLWHQMMLIDKGARLGSSYFGFRSAACDPQQTGPGTQHMKWIDKPGIEGIVGALIKDVVIRHRFEDCVDIPENHKYSVSYTLDKKHRALYQEMADEQLLLLKGRSITAVNAAAVYTKLLQIASGAVYSTADDYVVVDAKRYDLVLDLVEARAHSVTFFSWKHQRDQLVAAAEKRGISFAVFDGSTSDKERARIVKDFQAGLLQTIFAQPQSAGRGLTLTRGTATIWASPTYNLEHFAQGWKRVHRIGQTQKTETIVVVAENTIDEQVWEVLNNKEAKMSDLLNEIRELTK
jgi:SNF2 family DNA or RNA helicase